ncbi:hypothetical protein FA13DRAFT_180488 [Coprinellus micaceus]|uniref:Uncharacterized protein n=1 Tax=Coprinellus micaceus TaxID=71717 RepID=A0A4Y7TFU1_COPMI|nr:hypothetical protein FA13DRAFT_180488 [Coprinellus micaceus]
MDPSGTDQTARLVSVEATGPTTRRRVRQASLQSCRQQVWNGLKTAPCSVISLCTLSEALPTKTCIIAGPTACQTASGLINSGATGGLSLNATLNLFTQQHRRDPSMIKVEARSPSPAQLKHRAAPPERARTIHPVSYSNFRIVSAEARSDAPLAALLDAAYRENDSLREEIRQREEREKRILGLLLWHEQAVQKSGKVGTTPRPSSGLYAANPRNPSQDKDFYHVRHNPLLTLGRPPDQAYTLANRSNGKENHLKTNSYRSETRALELPKASGKMSVSGASSDAPRVRILAFSRALLLSGLQAHRDCVA